MIPDSDAGPAPGLHVRGRATLGGKIFFSNLDLHIAPGRWTCLLGVSGVGKTTVLRIIAGLDAHVSFDGSLETSDGRPATGRVVYMAQDHLLFPWSSILENVATGAILRGEAVDWARCREILERVGLADQAGKKPHALSGGERQRAALARTLMEDRPIILLDEPFSALDAATRAEMQNLAAALLRNRTVFLVTHDPLEAARLGDAIVVMRPDRTDSVEPPASEPPRPVDDRAMLTVQGRLHRHMLDAA